MSGRVIIRMAMDDEIASLVGQVDEGIHRGTIRDWNLLTWDNSDDPWFVVVGIPVENPTKLRRTSPVVAIDPQKRRVRTLNSVYELENQLEELDFLYVLSLLQNIGDANG